jgi:hypothetical protein
VVPRWDDRLVTGAENSGSFSSVRRGRSSSWRSDRALDGGRRDHSVADAVVRFGAVPNAKAITSGMRGFRAMQGTSARGPVASCFSDCAGVVAVDLRALRGEFNRGNEDA